ncbi:uncharacterized protein LOC113294944 [Papaver somniferum]|uniref:uncharacterized protein LOC113294944 n=1 Tax=Papaver somniferum TaxID=3469 RepID=UPI000E6F770C|nr:uncharacterized protein LOC113294944 [Papaver somniferum]
MEMIDINELPVLSGGEDKRIWPYRISGEFSVASVVEKIRDKFLKLHWTTQVWHSSIHPNVSSNIWKLVGDICATDENLRKRKVQLASRCCFCRKEEENKDHILWFCNFSELIWKWLGNMFNFINPYSFEEVLKKAKNKSPAIKEIWRITYFITMRELWFTRNKCLYEEEGFSLEQVKKKILKCTRVKEIFFHLPTTNNILLCCDGASKGNPSISGYGFIERTHSGEFLIVVSGGLGISTNYYAEILSILNAGEWAVSKGHREVWFITDSAAAIYAFQSRKVPWFSIKRWEKICASLNSWCFIHSYKEVNFSADGLAKKGANLARGERRVYLSRPEFLVTLEIPNKSYYKFY